MKIAVISAGHIPSIWAHSINTMKHAEAFYNLGHKIEILTIERIFEKILRFRIKNVHDFYDINKYIKIRYFKDNIICYFEEIPIINYILINLVPLPPKIRYFSDPEKKISKYCRKDKVDLSYCRAYRAAYYNILNQIPTIIESHTTNFYNKDLIKVLKLCNNKYLIGIVTIHNDIKNRYIELGVPPEKILVLEDAVELDKFEKVKEDKMKLRKELELPLKKKIIMYCGNIKPIKGIGKILETATYFDQDVVFYVLGGIYKDLNYWNKIIKNKRIKNVIFTGFIKNKIVPKYLKSADVLFMPFDLKEKDALIDINSTSPIKLFEYMASRKPIVTLNIPTIEKITRHKKEAILAKSDDPYDYASSINLLLKNESLAKEMAENAYTKAKKFTYNIRCKKILKYFYNI